MRIFLFLTLIINCNIVLSQNLEGFIKDSITGEKLPLSNLVFLNKNRGTNSDLNGYYKIQISEFINDTLKISYIGYKPLLIPLKKYEGNKDINHDFLLVQNENKLEEVIISQKRFSYSKKVKINENKEGDISMFSLIGHETTCLIENAKNELGRIESLKIYIRKNKQANFIAKFRIKFYSYDKDKNLPGEYLLNEDIIIEPKNKTYKLNLNLEKYKIPFLENGVCIGIEMLDENNNTKIGDKIGPGLRFTYGEKKQLTWYNYRDKGWGKNDLHNRKNNNISNLMLGLTVLYKK